MNAARPFPHFHCREAKKVFQSTCDQRGLVPGLKIQGNPGEKISSLTQSGSTIRRISLSLPFSDPPYRFVVYSKGDRERTAEGNRLKRAQLFRVNCVETNTTLDFFPVLFFFFRLKTWNRIELMFHLYYVPRTILLSVRLWNTIKQGHFLLFPLTVCKDFLA